MCRKDRKERVVMTERTFARICARINVWRLTKWSVYAPYQFISRLQLPLKKTGLAGLQSV